MLNIFIKFLLKFATSKVAEELVAIGVNKLVKSQDSGIKKELANTMINGIVSSKANPSTDKLLKVAFKELELNV